MGNSGCVSSTAFFFAGAFFAAGLAALAAATALVGLVTLGVFVALVAGAAGFVVRFFAGFFGLVVGSASMGSEGSVIGKQGEVI